MVGASINGCTYIRGIINLEDVEIEGPSLTPNCVDVPHQIELQEGNEELMEMEECDRFWRYSCRHRC